MSHVSQYPSTFYRVSLKAVIRNEKGEILACKEYDSDSYSLPGGGWDHGETEHECLARELKEEVGYEGNFDARPVKTAIWWLESRRAWLLWIVYNVTTENMSFSTTEACKEVVFVNLEIFNNSEDRAYHWIYEHIKEG